MSACPDMVVLHYTGMPTAQAALDRLLSPLHEVSCHYFVAEDGRIIQMVPERLRAWHAGEGNWNGEDDVNSSSIGIEIVNPGHDNGYPEFPETSDRRGGDLVPKHPAAPRNPHRSHSCAFGRRAFAQARSGREISVDVLHRSGVGHWVEPEPIVPGPEFDLGDSGNAIQSFQMAFRDYGYGIPTDGVFDQFTL